MLRRLLMAGTILMAPLGIGTYVVASQGTAAAAKPSFDNSTDTVTCDSFVGKAQISPALALNGAAQTTVKIKAKLYGCTDGTGLVSGSKTSANIPFSGLAKGVLYGTSNDLSSLSGCSSYLQSPAPSLLTVKWKAWYIDPTLGKENLLYKYTYVTIHQIDGVPFVPGAPFNTGHLQVSGYGSFEIGQIGYTDGGCTPPTYQTPAAFLGTDNGASSSTVAVTSESTTALLFGQTDKGLSTTKTLIDIGMGAYYGG